MEVIKGTSKNCFFGVRLRFLNPHLQKVNSGLKILSALKNQVFRGSLKQFDIYWVRLDPTQGGEIAKTRPCAVVSPNELNNHLRKVVIVPISSTIRGVLFRVACHVEGKNGEMAVDQIRSIDKSRISTCLGRLTSSEISQLRDVLNKIFCQ